MKEEIFKPHTSRFEPFTSFTTPKEDRTFSTLIPRKDVQLTPETCKYVIDSATRILPNVLGDRSIVVCLQHVASGKVLLLQFPILSQFPNVVRYGRWLLAPHQHRVLDEKMQKDLHEIFCLEDIREGNVLLPGIWSDNETFIIDQVNKLYGTNCSQF